jgi:hypothetical protein
MHCLYCDRPLALLKRLTGDGEFCSKEHRKIYQKEHNQLALARLLDAQPNNNNKKAKLPGIPQTLVNPAPAAAPQPVEKREERRQPERAGFISDFLREASAAALAHRSSAVPRFQSVTPVLAESISSLGMAHPLPKAASIVSESATLFFAHDVRFPGGFRGSSGAEPLAGSPKLEELHADGGAVPKRRQPGRAGFITGQPLAPVSASASVSAKGRPAAGPRFSPLVPVRMRPGAGICRRGADPKLPLAAYIPTFAARVRSIPDRIRRLASEPRWRPLAAALPTRPVGRITLVLGSFLRRPVRIASQDTLPESFEIRFRPVCFPRYSPRMGILEDRSLGTDRMGTASP